MSTLTSLVKSGKRKIIKAKTVEPAEGERKPLESARVSASTRSFLGQPDPGVSRGYLSQPDPGVLQDATRPQHDSESD